MNGRAKPNRTGRVGLNLLLLVSRAVHGSGLVGFGLDPTRHLSDFGNAHPKPTEQLVGLRPKICRVGLIGFGRVIKWKKTTNRNQKFWERKRSTFHNPYPRTHHFQILHFEKRNIYRAYQTSKAKNIQNKSNFKNDWFIKLSRASRHSENGIIINRVPSSSIKEEEDQNGNESLESIRRSSNFWTKLRNLGVGIWKPRFQLWWRERERMD